MADRAVLQSRLEQGIAALGLALPEDAVQRLLDYQALLERWNAAYNLTAIRDICRASRASFSSRTWR